MKINEQITYDLSKSTSDNINRIASMILNSDINIVNKRTDKEFIIKPLLIEAYLYKEPDHKDESCHKNKNQQATSVLDFHKRKNSELVINYNYRRGVDICVSGVEKIYFSFLLKVSRIDDKIYTQNYLAKYLMTENDYFSESDFEFKLTNNNDNNKTHYSIRRKGISFPKNSTISLEDQDYWKNVEYGFTLLDLNDQKDYDDFIKKVNRYAKENRYIVVHEKRN